MSSLRERIDEALEHYEYVLVGVDGEATDNKLYCNFPTTLGIMYRDFTIRFGAERVSKVKRMVRIDNES